MFEGGLSADLIVIVAVAVFIVIKYRQVLGHKTGHDTENEAKRTTPSEGRVVSLRQAQDSIIEAIDEPKKDTALDALDNEPMKATLLEMKALEQSFSLDEFVQGAKAAFEMVMDAFNQQDRATLKALLSDELYREFDQEMKQSAKQNQRPVTTLVSIVSAQPVAATLTKQQAHITMQIVSEQIQLIKNDQDEIVEGDVSRIEQIEDEWVFERQLGSRNPNWTITDM